MELTLNHLLYEGVSMESARNDAYRWALSNTDETMAVIANAEEKYRVKYEMRNKKSFTGKELCKRMNDGVYKFPFIIYKRADRKKQHVKYFNETNEGFDHPCELVVRDGVGIVHLQAVMISANSGNEWNAYERVKYNLSNFTIMVYIQMRKETVTQSAFLRNVCNFLI